MPTSLLRVATAGSVDDGKSTLVGRLLYDSKSVLADQLAAVEEASRRRHGAGAADLALLTDGLRAEREQGITIDVAYRYFATGKRRFILADTPGHVQYTRNMVTGASTAELLILLVDARKGIVTQTRRHAAVAALLRVPHVVLAVNKMDLVGYDEATFAAIAADFATLAEDVGLSEIAAVTAIPVSAADGDNVATPADTMPWYGGPTILELLETVASGDDLVGSPMRLPVQYVIRSGRHRAYAGQLAGGVLRVGERVTVLPECRSTTVAAIDLLGTSVPMAWAPQSVSVRLADDVEVGRGDLIAPAHTAPEPVSEVRATVCQLDDRPLRVGEKVELRHGTRSVPAVVQDVEPSPELGDLSCAPGADRLAVNEIGRVLLRTAQPVVLDTYATSRQTGSCLLVDPDGGATLAAGIVTH
ncbi:sulfate adenylyltransferase subunit 1 [Krasilnikovia sp. MM14-A1259]|uniref:sulfate adenylyltransferase subunit 1 n=1 Tax=Krasilnikovia sp. MM14-A1259 TaxID=3373539 RepID=UPI0038117F65